MRPISFTRSQPAADADSVANEQLLNASGAITLDGVLVSGGVATLTVPAQLTVIKLACRVFVFALPHSHRECARAL